MSRFARIGHDLTAAAKIAWYGGQYALTTRRSGPLTPPGEAPFHPSRPSPGNDALLASMMRLVARDRSDENAGLLPPTDFALPDPRRLLSMMRRYFDDLEAVDRRRLSRSGRQIDAPELRGRYPNYYLQNFHYQTGGYLSKESAALYDWQVETLFSGTALLMRRQGLVPIARHLAGCDQRQAALLEIGCGTGSFLSEASRAWPRLGLIGLDLSRPYLEQAALRLGAGRRRLLIEGLGEAVPLADHSLDAVTAVYLFHELPSVVRTAVAAEMARLVKPDGIVVIVDALQKGDVPEFDGLLELFPIGFHEPYFASWTTSDLEAVFAPLGLNLKETRLAHLSKAMVFSRT